MIRFIRKLMTCPAGATAIEYGLILSLVVIAAMVGMVNLADTTIGMWDNVADIVEKKS